MERHQASAGSRQELGRLLEAVLTSRGQANAVFDILAVLQVSRACGRGGPGEASGSQDGAERHLVGPPVSVRGPRGDQGRSAHVQPTLRYLAGAGRAVRGLAA